MNSQDQSSRKPFYRGSSKHKDRPTGEQKGTLCPEWTHEVNGSGFATDVHAHYWAKTEASLLFEAATIDASTGRRYATSRDIAFEAKSTADGSWHGYPIPWESVPDKIRRDWEKEGKITRRAIRKFFRFEKQDIQWALKTDLR